MRLLLNELAMSSGASPSVSTAASLRDLADRLPGERGRLASTGALVLHVVEGREGEGAPGTFLFRRVLQEVRTLGHARDRTHLLRLLGAVEERARPRLLSERLTEYACALESSRRLEEARAALSLARTLAPDDAGAALHAGRVARLAGDPVEALALYGIARDLASDGPLARLAAVGEAAVAAEPRGALSRIAREAIRAGDAEAAAVALEERGRLRRKAGDLEGAARDLFATALRFPEGADRARVAHALADVALAAGDPEVARQAMLAALETGDRPQREHARSRLHALARDAGDRVGMRRWRSFERAALVSLTSPTLGTRPPLRLNPRMERWRAAARSA
jgi:tetratricopeptide (TPR) repeat protein